jgi:pyruvate dehydrogenase E1 component alpha subunit
MSDPGKYRTKEELEERKAKDPMLRARAALEGQGYLKRIEAIEAEVEATVEDAVKFADESAEPGPELLEQTTYKGAFAR